MQSLVQPGAARVAREHAAGAVRAMRRRREPDDEQTRPRVAEPRDRPPPVLPIAEGALLLARHAAAVRAQPGATGARHNRTIDAGERSEHGRVSVLYPHAEAWARQTLPLRVAQRSAEPTLEGGIARPRLFSRT